MKVLTNFLNTLVGKGCNRKVFDDKDANENNTIEESILDKDKALQTINCNLKSEDSGDKEISVEMQVDMMTQEEMEAINEFDVYKPEDKDNWYLVLGYCQIGGCDMYIEEHTEYLTALKRGTIKTLRKVKPLVGACNSCRIDLQEGEETAINEKERIRKERAALRGTGNKIIDILSTKRLELRQFYDSRWEINVKTERGEELISITYTDVYEILPELKACYTTGDIKSLEKSGLIYYD